MRRPITIGLIVAAIAVIGLVLYFGWNYFFTTIEKQINFEPIYQFEPFEVVVVRGESVERYLTINIEAELADVQTYDQLQRIYPRIIDNYLVELMDYFALIRPNETPNAADIRDRLYQVNRYNFGDNRIFNIQIKGIFERRQRS